MRPDPSIIEGSNGSPTDPIQHLAEDVAPQRPRAIPGRPVALFLSGPEPLGLAS